MSEGDEDVQEAMTVLIEATDRQHERELREFAAGEGLSPEKLDKLLARFRKEGRPWRGLFAGSFVAALVAAVVGGLLRPLIL